MIRLDGKVDADLDWKKARLEALQTDGPLIWEIDLGLFDTLKQPLSHKSQLMSLRLSLEHFRDGLWKEFHERTNSVIIYQGSLEFSDNLIWNGELEENFKVWCVETHLESKNLFCVDVLADYLNLLTQGYDMPFKVVLDASTIEDPAWEAALANRERFGDMRLDVENSTLQEDKNAKTAICFPSATKVLPNSLSKILMTLIQEKMPFRIIPEAYLLNEWDCLDELIVDAESIDLQLKRKLQGFEAAGGLVTRR